MPADIQTLPTHPALGECLPSPGAPLGKMRHSSKIHDRFVIVARLHPEAVALTSSRDTYTYGELDTLSNALASRLQHMAGGHSGPVAIYGKRSGKLIISMLACSRAGLTFAVLDSAYPSVRLVSQIDIIQPSIILAVDTSDHDLDSALGLNDDPRLLFVDDVLLATLREERPVTVTPVENMTAYLLFTSGTTGQPKCISHSHTPLIHFVAFYENTFAPTPADHFSVLSGLGHDPVMRDIFVPLSIGASLCIPQQGKIADPLKLFSWIQSEKISYLHATPQLLKLLCAGARGRSLPALRYIFSGGDALGIAIVHEVRDLAPHCQVVNFYGSTETPQAVAYHVVTDRDETFIPIGKGIADTQLLVLTDDYTQALAGEIGQIAVRTHFLSEGYLGDASLTAEKFIISPFTQEPDDLIYLTGDYGCYREDGAVIVRGRLDDQVKIRGYRVETSEICHILEKQPGLNGCLVLAQAQPTGEQTLIAYLVAPTDNLASIDDLKSAIAASLPAYMMPSKFIWISAFPLLPNGKIDRTRLAAMATDNAPLPRTEDIPFQRASDREMIEAFQDIFGVHSIDKSKSFNELGGDSLSFIHASMSVEKALGSLPEDWQNISISDLLKHRRTSNARSYSISTSVIMRAVSICLIVVSHFSGFGVFGDINSTAVLFALAGWSFANYQLDSILKTGSVKPLLLTALGVAVPTIVYSLMFELYKGKVYWQSLLLITNFFDPNFADFFNFWFLEVLVQIFLLLAILFSIKPVRDLALKNTFAFSIFATIASRVVAEAIELFWNVEALEFRLPQEKITVVFLGMALALASTTRRKIIAIAVLALLELDGQLGLYPFGAILFMLIVVRVPLPVWLAHAVNLVAVSSLFIYLTHIQFKLALVKTPLGDYLWAITALSVVGGVLVWKIWSLVWPRFTHWLNSQGKAPTQP